MRKSFAAASLRRTAVSAAVAGLLAAAAAFAAAQQPTSAPAPAPTANETLEEVVITAIVDASRRAVEQQKNSRGITNVVSADGIGRFPDPNIAEALQRVVGVAIARDQGEGRYINVRGGPSEFSAVTIDGVSIAAPDPSTRAIDLDTVPSDIVGALEISKTLRPDQDADSVTGAVNIKTQSAFDYAGFRARASLGGSYNEFGGTHDLRGSFSVSNILEGDSRIGLLLSGSYSETDRQVDNVETAWSRLNRPEGGSVFGLAETLFKDYDTRRERLAFTGAAELRTEDDTRLYARGTFSRFIDDEYRNQLLVLWSEGVLLPGATDERGAFRNIRVAKQIRHRVVQNEIVTGELGGQRDFGDWRFDGSLSIASTEQTYPRRDELLWRTAALGTATAPISYDYGVNPREPAISLFVTNQHLNPANFSFRENAFRTSQTSEDTLAVAGNISLPVEFGTGKGSLRFGGKFKAGERKADENRFRDRAAGAAPSGPLAGFLTTEASRNYGYDLGFKVAPGLADAYFDAAKGSSPIRAEQSATADYRADEDVLAGYAQWDLDFERLGILAGVRLERTRTEGSAPVFNAATGAISTRTDERSYTGVFPGLTLRYEFADSLIGRAAATRGMTRPNFTDIVPRALETQEGSLLVVQQGNPLLEPTLSNNLDVSLEYYFQPMGLLSAGAFYKDLRDYNYTLRSAGSYLGTPAAIITPENADGEMGGIELAWQQQFTSLPGWLGGFGVFANFTYVDASIDLGRTYGGRSSFPLPGQSETVTNFALFYERGPLSVRISFTDRSDYLNEINAEDGALDLYWAGRDQVDLTASWQFTKAFEAFIEAKNLTNSPGIRYYGKRSRVYEYEQFGYSVFLGGRLKL
jgi:TonB-dependent receptor